MKYILFILFVLNIFFTNGQTIVNAYARVTFVSGATLTVNNVNQANHTFEVGQLVVLMQMQADVIGANTLNTINFGNLATISSAGLYEIRRIVSINGNISANFSSPTPTTIVLDGVNNTYSTSSNSSLQLITFRQMSTNNFTTSSNITALNWDGNIGGVVAMDVPGILTLSHNISADGRGFRGGAVSSNFFVNVSCVATPYRSLSANFGWKGEGIYRSTNINYRNARAKILTGGGGGVEANGGGGGGGNFEAGGNGGGGWNGTAIGCTGNAGFGFGGIALSSVISSNRIFMGGGGGGGQQNNSASTSGANGGGIVIIRANEITTSGVCAERIISVNGNSAASAGNDGAGGGGAAGSIVFFVDNWNILASCDLIVNANGGSGGTINTSTHAGGGAGAQGVVQFGGAQPTTNITTTTLNGVPGCNNSSIPCSNSAGSASGTNNAGIFSGSGTPLPIELTSFTATLLTNETVDLLWQTASETNSSFFTLERSADGIQWDEIAGIKAAGNSTQLINYRFIDDRPLVGLSYYRLNQTDVDGTEKKHGIRSIMREGEELQLFPNPAQNLITIQGYLGENAVVKLFDLLGKNVHSFTSDDSISKSVDVDISHLKSGIYFIVVEGKTMRFVKN